MTVSSAGTVNIPTRRFSTEPRAGVRRVGQSATRGPAGLGSAGPPGRRDLAYASALVDGAERLWSQPDLPALFAAIAAEAATVIAAAHTAVVCYTGMLRRVDRVYVPGHLATEPYVDMMAAVAAEAWLVAPGTIPDLAVDGRWSTRTPALAGLAWRAAITVPLISLTPQHHHRLSWFSDTPGAFDTIGDVADLLAGQANLAIRTVGERLHLAAAVDGQTRIGQAQGIVMALQQLSAEEALSTLHRQAQTSNVTISAVADSVIATAQHPTVRNRTEEPPGGSQVNDVNGTDAGRGVRHSSTCDRLVRNTTCSCGLS